MGVPFDVNETCGKVTGGFATGWERGTESEANAPEDGRILIRVYENKYFGFDCRLVGASRTEGVRRASTQKEGADRSAGQVEGRCGCRAIDCRGDPERD